MANQSTNPVDWSKLKNIPTTLLDGRRVVEVDHVTSIRLAERGEQELFV